MKYLSLVALGAFLMPINVQAADLGGDCCADLEERVAELEATAVKATQKKVALTVSGQVNAALIYYDFSVSDGDDSFNSKDMFVGMGQGSASRVQIDGRAEINKDWEAGFRFSFTFDGTNGSDIMGSVNDLSDIEFFNRPTDDSIGSREAYVFLRNKQLGAVSIGTRDAVLQSAGKVDITERLNTQGNLDPASQMGILGVLASQGDGDGGISQRAGIRYDSPSVAGFILSADWTNKNSAYDSWGVRVSFGNQFGDFKVAAAAAYGRDQGVLDNTLGITASLPEETRMVASGGIMHVPTGIFVNASWGETDTGFAGDQNSSHWAVQAGIQTKPFSIGKTTLYGAYYHSKDNSIIINEPVFGVPVYLGGEYEIDYWGLGIVQDIDAASMSLYAGYRNYSSDNCQSDLDLSCDLDVYMAGAIIRF